MSILRDDSLIDRVIHRNMVVQVNADYFLNPKTRKSAFQNLKDRKIQLIGSDCHNMDSRPPNLGPTRKLARSMNMESAFYNLNKNAVELLLNRRK